MTSYWSAVPNVFYRQHIHNVLSSLAFLYKVEMRSVYDYKFDPSSDFAPQPDCKHSFDLLYFHSEYQTILSAREFRKLIDDTVGKALNPFECGVEIDCMLMRVVPYFPFPKDL